MSSPAVPSIAVDDASSSNRASYIAHRAYMSAANAFYASHNVTSAVDYIELQCRRNSSSHAIEFVGHDELRSSPLTYGEWNDIANRLSKHWISVGMTAPVVASSTKSSSTLPVNTRIVSVMMENCPFFLILWLSLAKLGITVALLNTSLKGRQMKHAIDIAHSDAIIVSDRFDAEWSATRQLYVDEGREAPKEYRSQGAAIVMANIRTSANASSSSSSLSSSSSSSPSSDATFIEQHLSSPDQSVTSDSDYSSYRSSIHLDSALFLIYTSGTTGPSKAAIFSHRRFIGAGVTWSHPMNLSADDKYLITLPLYHGNGGVVAVSAAIHVGCCMVIREKFSTTHFWSDVRLHNVTAMIYVGELWRYLHNAHRSASDIDNPLRVIAGNGLRADIWSDVMARFGISTVVEHYGMTEMPAGPYMNFQGKVGACGYIPTDIRASQKADALVKYDCDTGTVKRDEHGRCIRVTNDGETGEALFLLAPGVSTDGDAASSQAINPHTESGAVDVAFGIADTLGNPLYNPYRNYTEVAACAKRVYRNVFQPLDAWFATGDLLRVDNDGFVFFVDRMGDSYRWKGENVATSEVAEALCQHPRVHEANVYGVEWKGQDGKAGMASLVWKEEDESNVDDSTSTFDGASFLRFLLPILPAFALPSFIRVRSSSSGDNAKTSTLKFQKTICQQDGFDPSRVGDDRLYYWPGATMPKRDMQKMIDEEEQAKGEGKDDSNGNKMRYVRITQELYDQMQTVK